LAAAAAAAMGRLEIDWDDVFDNSSTDHEEGIYLGSPSPAATKRARTGAEGVARASSGDEQPRGTQALHLRLEALCSELERRVGELRPVERSPVTRASAKVHTPILSSRIELERSIMDRLTLR
jgi:hypothetical protein